MLSNTSASEEVRPLLEQSAIVNNGDNNRTVWWRRRRNNNNKILDLEEAKDQILFALPMIFTNAFYYLIPLISVMFAGHLGQLELAGATLANSWSVVTGLALLTGLSGALETLCGQAFGAKAYKMLGIHLQASCVITMIFSIIISILWVYTEPILILLNQEHEIAKAAGLYLEGLIPGLFAYGLLQNIMRFLQTQSVVLPLVALSGIPTLIHVGVAYALVNCTALGYRGAPLAASISLWISLIMSVLYVIYSTKFVHTWEGFSFGLFRHIPTNLKLALPSAAMVCLEYCAFEILVLLAGMMPDSEITTSLIAICVSTEATAFMSVNGLSAAVSTRVSNELGADDPDRAKNAVTVTLKISILFALIIDLALVLGHNIWAETFSSSSTIIHAFSSMTPLLVISITLDAFQGILSGVARGCGWQHLAVIANLATFYLIGMPIAALLGFKFKFYVKGLWIGLICGLSCQAFSLLMITLCRKWAKIDISSGHDKDKENVGLA